MHREFVKGMLFLAATLLGGCDLASRWTPDASLSASGDKPPAVPDCASCHAYPLHDLHHGYHLLSPNANYTNLGHPQLNGAMTCLDCHFQSIRHFAFDKPDSIWIGSDGTESH